jgi:hypothetical protein
VSQITVVEILIYHLKKESDKVEFDLPDENDSFSDTIKAKKLSAKKQLENSKIQLEFFKNHT